MKADTSAAATRICSRPLTMDFSMLKSPDSVVSPAMSSSISSPDRRSLPLLSNDAVIWPLRSSVSMPVMRTSPLMLPLRLRSEPSRNWPDAFSILKLAPPALKPKFTSMALISHAGSRPLVSSEKSNSPNINAPPISSEPITGSASRGSARSNTAMLRPSRLIDRGARLQSITGTPIATSMSPIDGKAWFSSSLASSSAGRW